MEKLRDKTLCIDLSIWICEAQGTKGLKDQLKPYLRNVFFRTLYLVSIGVRPVFVIDGIPPELKRETILKRLDTRCELSGKRKNVSDKQRKLKRSKFNIWCNEVSNVTSINHELKLRPSVHIHIRNRLTNLSSIRLFFGIH